MPLSLTPSDMNSNIKSNPQDERHAAAPSPSPSIAATSNSAHSTGTAVKWADQSSSLGGNESEDVEVPNNSVTGNVTAGKTKMVGWTFENANKLLETQTSSKKLRPMHVRVSVRVHHVAFLHPGLDNGSRATISDRSSGRWKFAKMKNKKSASPPGLLQFGNKKGNWKNPMSPKNKPFGNKTNSKDEGVMHKLRKEFDNEDQSEISDIISAEAFRLSRDGIIQHHYLLKHAASVQPPPTSSSSSTTPATHRRFTFEGARMSVSPSSMYPGTSFRRFGNAGSGTPQKSRPSSAPTHNNNQQKNNNIRSNNNNIMLSPYASSNPQEAARYYKECAQRPKGYRRLVVSSAIPTSDVPIPSPPTYMVNSNDGKLTTQKSERSRGTTIGGYQHRESSMMDSSHDANHRASWSFEKSPSTKDIGPAEKEKKKNDDKKEHLFDHVEYQYVGPPNTGPDFFQLLRRHGAATFGRYLPELACNVPNHSIGFEVRKSKSKRRLASTQPLVVEAPHIIWGDARDKMLSKIAKEGCPLIDSRKFEYVSNADLDDTELSESLMVCGATLWVQNAPDDEESVISTTSTLKPQYTKGMVKAEYYGGKFVDGVTDGMKGLTKGLKKGTKETWHAAEKGTKEVVKGMEEGTKHLLPPIPHDQELASIPASTAEAQSRKTRKRDKVKALFNPKKVGNKLRRRSRKKGDDGQSVDGSSIASSVGGNDSIATDSEHVVSDAVRTAVEHEDLDDEHIGDINVSSNEQEEKEEYIVVKPVPYVLLLDDVIDIRIVSFPDKDDVIANFPISVASVMVQRSMDDRINDPLKPSELTATLIQEPCAQQMQWGVELKVTLRAVEVKPNIPRVIPRPKDVVDEEIKHIKDQLKLLGKKPEEIKKTLKEKEDEQTKVDNDLNSAIVMYGYGKGEDAGAGIKEVRLRQMFYCEGEQSVIERKVKRRTMITDFEKQMLNDSLIDPSTNREKSYSKEEKQKLLDLLNVNFPGIEKEDMPADDVQQTTQNRGMTGSSVSSNNDVTVADSLARVSMSMAKSLDICLESLIKKPTVPKVEHRLRHTFTEGMRPQVTTHEAKKWCLDVAEKLSTLARSQSIDANIESTIAKIQTVIAESALGSGASFNNEDDGKEEMKLDEDEIALAETKSSNSRSDADASELVEWVNAVASQLDACAEELDDGEESLAHSETLDSIEQVGEKVLESESPSKTANSSSKSEVEGKEDRSPLPSPPRCTSDPDEMLWERVLSQKQGSSTNFSNSSTRIRSATSISTIKQALPKKTKTKEHRSQIESLLKRSRSHKISSHSHQASSLSATLLYLALVMALFALGSVMMFQSYRYLWSSSTI